MISKVDTTRRNLLPAACTASVQPPCSQEEAITKLRSALESFRICKKPAGCYADDSEYEDVVGKVVRRLHQYEHQWKLETLPDEIRGELAQTGFLRDKKPLLLAAAEWVIGQSLREPSLELDTQGFHVFVKDEGDNAKGDYKPLDKNRAFPNGELGIRFCLPEMRKDDAKAIANELQDRLNAALSKKHPRGKPVRVDVRPRANGVIIVTLPAPVVASEEALQTVAAPDRGIMTRVRKFIRSHGYYAAEMNHTQNETALKQFKEAAAAQLGSALTISSPDQKPIYRTDDHASNRSR